jgi:hypothetical protein
MSELKLQALAIADSWLSKRTQELFNTPYSIRNVQELAGFILKWAEEDEDIMTQIAATIPQPEATKDKKRKAK